MSNSEMQVQQMAAAATTSAGLAVHSIIPDVRSSGWTNAKIKEGNDLKSRSNLKCFRTRLHS